MAFNLTARTRSILNQVQKNPSVALDIEGIERVYSSSVVLKRIAWDEDSFSWDDPDASWDSSVASDEFLPYINLKQSTNIITQTIYPDKEGASSISSVQMSIIDKNGSVSKAFSSNSIGEILGKKVEFRLGFVGGVYPVDFMPVMNGIIVDFYYQAGSVNLTISHADTLRRQTLLTGSTTKTVEDISDSDLGIVVNNPFGIAPEAEGFNNYIKIGDELMDVDIVNAGLPGGSGYTVKERGSLGTTAVAHDAGSEVKFAYTLEGNPLELAQRIMMSTKGNSNIFNSDYEIVSFQQSGSDFIDNAIIINHPDIESATGLIIGDFVWVLIDGSFYDIEILSFGILDSGFSYIVVDKDLDTESDLDLKLSFRSQYNIYEWGLGMFPFEVDNSQIEYIKSTFSPNFTDMFFYIEDGIENARDFINKELYFVSGCYGIPRNARSSVKFLSPPLSSESLPNLNEKSVTNLIDLKPIRSVNKFYYNDILFSYSESLLDGEFKTFTEFINSDSVDDFQVGTRQLSIKSKGLRDSTQVELAVNRLASRFLDRYKQAAVYIKDVKLPFKYGFNIQVGDVVLFGGSGVKLTNYTTGERELPIQKYEVINQKIELTGVISLDLLSTGYAVEGTFATFSPSSLVESATTTNIKVKRINNADGFSQERDKYNELIGVKLRIRSSDFSYDQITTLLRLDDQDRNTIIVEELPTAPLLDYIVELANYDDQDDYGTSDAVDTMKQKYSFTMPQVGVTSGDSAYIFDVDSVDNLFVGASVSVHSLGFTVSSDSSKIVDITGLKVTVDTDLSFTPSNGDLVEVLTNKDGFDGYLFL